MFDHGVSVCLLLYVTLIGAAVTSWSQMDKRVIWASGHGIVLVGVLAGITFVFELWGVLIALAPAAYVLVFSPNEEGSSPRAVVITHLTALITGWVTYSVLAHGITPTGLEPMSEPALRIVGSALLAFVASTAIFYILQLKHPMAYVMTFTTAIGGFPTLQAFAVVAGAILVVGGLQAVRRKFGPDADADSDNLIDRPPRGHF